MDSKAGLKPIRGSLAKLLRNSPLGKQALSAAQQRVFGILVNATLEQGVPVGAGHATVTVADDVRCDNGQRRWSRSAARWLPTQEVSGLVGLGLLSQEERQDFVALPAGAPLFTR